MTLKISIFGIVQGVGFRPYALREAEELGIKGTVKNIGGVVEIMAQSDKQALDEYIQRLALHLPESAMIIDMEAKEVPQAPVFENFRIIKSDGEIETTPVLPPDIATCKSCEKELADSQNRRHRHPFISCTACGPRYTIMERLPYDRETTVMDDFPMCPACHEEYVTTEDRRCHAQTIACFDCGPELVYSNGGDPIEEGIKALNEGKVLAIKDIGGYHFACSALIGQAAEDIREIKLREKKPFAVMFPSVESIREYAEVSAEEEKCLKNPARPIVLVKKKGKKDMPFAVCGESRDIGAFLPCNPVQIMLTEACGPLVMTSGNISGEPIITDNGEILELWRKNEKLHGVLYHNRRILTPVDDSVMRVVCGKEQMIRRARGYVPLPLITNAEADRQIFAAGGDLKACFSLVSGKSAYLSQYFGDLEDADCYKAYQEGYQHMSKLHGIVPAVAVSDMHPGYFSSQFAEKLGLFEVKVQHHHAHIASVIAEHKLDGEVLGFSFDGTGYGTDGTVWGGEVLKCNGADFERVAHLKSVKLCGGDTISKNAKTAKLCYMVDAGLSSDEPEFKLIKSAVENGINTVKSSSMGRLFDAVSSLLGIKDYNDYEGECAIALEKAAAEAADMGIPPVKLTLPLCDGVYKTDELIRQIAEKAAAAGDYRALALGFHRALADAVINTAKEFKISKIALSGGVFMNRMLTEMCLKDLELLGFEVYINEKVPTNDGGVSLGQSYIAAKLGDKGLLSPKHEKQVK